MTLALADLSPDDRVYRYVLTGHRDGHDVQEPQPLTVVRVNRRTATVRTDQGSAFRIEPHHLAGRWTDDAAAEAASAQEPLRAGETVRHRRLGARAEVLPYGGLTQGEMSGTFVRWLEPVEGLYDAGDSAEVSTHLLDRCAAPGGGDAPSGA